MSGKDRVAEDYRDSDARMEELVKKELIRIRKRADKLKIEAERVGEEVEASFKRAESSEATKKKS